MDEKETNSLTQPHADRKFTALRLDMRRIIPRGHSGGGSRCQVFVMSDRMTAFDLKKMAADKNGIDEDVTSGWHLVASVERGEERSKFIVPDDHYPLSICTQTTDCNVQIADDISKSSTSDGRRSNEDQSHVVTCKSEEEVDKRFQNGDARTFPKSNRDVSECLVHYEPSLLKQEDPKTTSEAPTGPQAGYLSGTGPPYLSNGGPVPSTGSQYQYGAFKVPVPVSISRVPDQGVLPGNRCSERKEVEQVVETEVNRLGIEKEASKRGNLEKNGTGFEGGGDPDRKSNPVARDPEVQQRESRISSLPDMEKMEARTGLERTGSSNSLPAKFRDLGGVTSISGGAGGGGGGRRCLPQLQVPDAIVEEKRSILSQKLERKLESFSRKNTKKKKRGKKNKKGYPGSSSGPDVRRIRPPGGEDSNDDDCISVTSWEVAEILAEADPMAPKDSDYEDSDNTSDDDDDDGNDDDDDDDDDIRDGRLLSSNLRSHGKPTSNTDTLEEGSGLDDDKFSPIQRNKEKTGSEHRKCPGSTPPSFSHSDTLAKPLPLSRDDVPPEKNKNKIPISGAIVPSRKAPSLCRLLSGNAFRLRISVLSAKLSEQFSEKSAVRLPFQVFNDVIYIDPSPAASSGGHVPTGKAGRERFVVPVIGESCESGNTWECLEGRVESGDIIVEVNGKITLQEPASAIVSACLNCCNDLQLVLARQNSLRRVHPHGSEN